MVKIIIKHYDENVTINIIGHAKSNQLCAVISTLSCAIINIFCFKSVIKNGDTYFSIDRELLDNATIFRIVAQFIKIANLYPNSIEFINEDLTT